jgi:hypothetical protein
VLTEHRSGANWRACRWIRPCRPEVRIAFEHSVLGTPVEDRYRFRRRRRLARPLVEERFQGDGYGLPHAAGPASGCSARQRLAAADRPRGAPAGGARAGRAAHAPAAARARAAAAGRAGRTQPWPCAPSGLPRCKALEITA